jgi:G3E family GTPase
MKGGGKDGLPAKQAKVVEKKLPVVVLTGYLGAGKTTLLNYVLNEQRDKKLAVIENEIGEVSVDDALVEQKHEDMAEELIVLDNGCVCCTIRGDLVKTLQDLAKKLEDKKVQLDGVLIELTGAADPAPVVQTFFMDAAVRRTFYVDNVIALVDAKHCVEKLDEGQGDPKEKGTACAQIAFSSTVLLNKIDLVDEATIEECEKRLKQVNRVVNIIRCTQGRVPLDKVLHVKAFDLSAVLEEQYMDEDEFHSFYKPKMDRSISNVGVKFEGALNMYKLQKLLDGLIGEEASAKDFLRIKGVLEIKGHHSMFVLQCVHMLRNQNFTKPWGKQQRENRIIFIGRGMQSRRQELTDGVMACITKPLRFGIGTRVQANTGGFSHGKVIRHWDDLNAYRIKLDNGEEVHAPVDEDPFVKAAEW